MAHFGNFYFRVPLCHACGERSIDTFPECHSVTGELPQNWSESCKVMHAPSLKRCYFRLFRRTTLLRVHCKLSSTRALPVAGVHPDTHGDASPPQRSKEQERPRVGRTGAPVPAGPSTTSLGPPLALEAPAGICFHGAAAGLRRRLRATCVVQCTVRRTSAP